MKSVIENKRGAEIKRRPITSYVLKIASRCNLNCKYCYVYNLTDKTYLNQPAVMSDEVVTSTIQKARNHCVANDLTTVEFIFHGGEPLLVGKDFLRNFTEQARKILLPQIRPSFSIQTNGTLLTTEWLQLLNELNISYGISLDGTPEVNDANRVDHQGKGSYHRVKAALDLIKSDPQFEQRMNGILSVINIHSDPIEIYRHFRSLGLRAIDLRLPDATHDIPPPGVDVNGTNTPYADWLIPIFDEWFAEADTEFNVRLFQYIIGLIFGSQKSTVDVGAISSNFAVIETDGGIEPSGALKACYEGITKVGLNVLSNEVEEIFDIPVVALFSTAENELPDTCKKCPIVSVCGGGKPPHRYSSANGFNNPSVYCRDLMKLIVHIQEKVVAELPEEVKSKMNLAPLKELVVAD
jgi:uncharacterized protein